MLESTRKNYNEDFKREVVRLIEVEGSIALARAP